jgi:hypothetical protein
VLYTLSGSPDVLTVKHEFTDFSSCNRARPKVVLQMKRAKVRVVSATCFKR